MEDKTKEQLLERIKELEAQVRSLNNSIIDRKDEYGLRWIDVPEAFEKEAENKIPILEEVKELAIKNDDGKPTHILIEGDNYHALQCLNYTHKGKIDVIYIDPPYNTGSDGFAYKDKRILKEFPNGTPVPKDHPLRHSYWLSFMSKRLELAKRLLKRDGVIFISINEDEYSQLKLLCDKIFLSENYVTSFTIKVRHDDRILKGDKPIHETTEQLLMYQRSSDFSIQKRSKDNSKPTDYKYKITELISNPSTIILGEKEVCVFHEGEYKIEEFEESFDNLKKINIRGSIKTGNSSGRFHMAYLEDKKNEFNVLYKVPNMGDDGLGYRYFISRKDKKQANGSYFQGSPLNRQDIREIPYPNFFDFESEFNEVGTEGGVPFGGGKKPIKFIQQILEIFTNKKSFVILDFFAGSGSTGHSIIDLNKDNGNRQFILIQSPDKTYEIKKGKKVAKHGASDVFIAGFERIVDVTYKRCENVMQGYTNAKGEQVEGLGNSLRYYKTAFVGSNAAATSTDEDKVALAHKAGNLIAIAENTLDEIETTDSYQIFQNANQYTAIYFTGNLEHFAEYAQKIESLRNSSRLVNVAAYIYCIGNVDVFENEFNKLTRINLHAIPQPIIEIYKQLNA
jgi:adenine-specific DNA-methyltransferase